MLKSATKVIKKHHSYRNQQYKCAACFVRSAVSQYEYVLQISDGIEAHMLTSALHAIYSVSDLQVH